MPSGTRKLVALLSAGLAIGWAAPAEANDPTRPPVQRPSSRPAEPEAAPPQTEPEQAQPIETEQPEAAQPIELAPAPVSEPPPAPEAVLPNYADVVVAEPHTWDDVNGPAPREVPPDGRGRLVIGSFAVLGGVGLMGLSIVLASKGREAAIWTPVLLPGVGGTITGALLLHGGRRRLHAYREWESARPDVVPPQGTGLVTSGGVLLAVGAGSGMFGTIAWVMSGVGFQVEQPRLSPVIPTMVGVGIGSLAVGTGLIIAGMKRHKRFKAWRTRPELVPGISPLPSGAQIGLSGRF